MEISRETLLVVLAVAALAPLLADLPRRARRRGDALLLAFPLIGTALIRR